MPRALSTSGNEMALLSLGVLGLAQMTSASGKPVGRQEAAGQPSTVSLCWERQARSCSGTGAPPAVFVSADTPGCSPDCGGTQGAEKQCFIPKREEYIPLL